jgi:hypothetical protein
MSASSISLLHLLQQQQHHPSGEALAAAAEAVAGNTMFIARSDRRQNV